MRDSTWYRMWGEVENERALGGIELGAPLHLKPTEDEWIPNTTRRSTGFMQRVQVVVSDPQGNLSTKTIDWTRPTLTSRQAAITKAIEVVEGITTSGSEGGEQYYHSVVTAFYGGTFVNTPE